MSLYILLLTFLFLCFFELCLLVFVAFDASIMNKFVGVDWRLGLPEEFGDDIGLFVAFGAVC